MQGKNSDLGKVLQKGLKLMFSRLVEKAIGEREHILTDEGGNPNCVKATELKHLIQ